MVALLGFLSALIYGASDFLGGLASRRMPAVLVTFVGAVVSTAISVVAVAVTAPTWSVDAVVLGIIAGVGGAIGTWALYACLAIGPMSVLSPGIAAIYAVVPGVVGIALGERFGPLGYIALVAVVIAGILLAVAPSGPDRARIAPRSLVYAALAGLGFAGYIIAIDRTPPESGLIPLLMDLGTGLLLFGAALVVVKLRTGSAGFAALRDRRALALALIAGATLVFGNILLVIGLHLGDLAVMSVLNSLYPLGTVLLAILILKERLAIWQGIGIGLALAGSIVLALD